jgi:biopolymer transport protein ExbD
MAMSVGSGDGSGEPEVMMDINTTPLIDVMLVLLVMLILTIPIQKHEVKMDMPTNNTPPPTTPPPVIEVAIDFDGSVTWQDPTGQVSQISNGDQLADKLQNAAVDPAQPEVHIRPNKLVAYKYVAAVLAAAQRLGVTKIGIVGNETMTE